MLISGSSFIPNCFCSFNQISTINIMIPAAGTFQSQDYKRIFSEQTELAALFPFRTNSKLSKQAIEHLRRNETCLSSWQLFEKYTSVFMTVLNVITLSLHKKKFVRNVQLFLAALAADFFTTTKLFSQERE